MDFLKKILILVIITAAIGSNNAIAAKITEPVMPSESERHTPPTSEPERHTPSTTEPEKNTPPTEEERHTPPTEEEAEAIKVVNSLKEILNQLETLAKQIERVSNEKEAKELASQAASLNETAEKLKAPFITSPYSNMLTEPSQKISKYYTNIKEKVDKVCQECERNAKAEQQRKKKERLEEPEDYIALIIKERERKEAEEKKESKEEKKESKESKEPRLSSLKFCLKQFNTIYPEFSLQYLYTGLRPAIVLDDHQKQLKEFKERCSKDSNFMDSKRWLAHDNPDIKQFQGSFKPNFLPYAQKIIVPVGSVIVIIGDIHGSMHSLLRDFDRLKTLGHLNDNYKILDKNNNPTYLVFTGDYVDRGNWSLEVLYTIIKLKLLNWDRVFLLRGNHEYAELNFCYGFWNESAIKFGGTDGYKLHTAYNDIFELFPLVLYMGARESSGHISFFQYCHGGIEPFYDPTELLGSSSEVMFEKLYTKNPDWSKGQQNDTAKALAAVVEPFKTTEPGPGKFGSNFVWGDFNDDEKPVLMNNSQRGAGFIFSMKAVTLYLSLLNEKLKEKKDEKKESKEEKNVSLCGIGRAHQHFLWGLKIGPEKHWLEVVKKKTGKEIDQKTAYGYPLSVETYGPVFTFSTAVEGVWLPYDCFGLLTIGDTFSKWVLQVYEIYVRDKVFARELTELSADELRGKIDYFCKLFDLTWENLNQQSISENAKKKLEDKQADQVVVSYGHDFLIFALANKAQIDEKMTPKKTLKRKAPEDTTP